MLFDDNLKPRICILDLLNKSELPFGVNLALYLAQHIMKKNILFLSIFLLTFLSHSQHKVVKESEKCENCGTKEQRAEIDRLDRELQELRRKIPYTNGQTSGNIKALKQRIANNQRALTYINDYDLVTKCNILKTKQRAINRPALCDIQKYEVERIKGLNNKIRARIKELESSEREQKLLEESEDIKKGIHSKKMDELDKELQALDNQLKNSKKKTSKKKSKTIDDFLADIDRKQTKKSNNNDFLADINNKKKKKSNNNDFLADIDNKKAKGNDFLGDIDSKVDKSSFEIKYKDGKQGVVDKNGRVLIPFKDWSILEYKMGIAKTYIRVRTTNICEYVENTYILNNKKIEEKVYYNVITYKEGYVDKKGEYIDGYNYTYKKQTQKTNPYGSLSITKMPCTNFTVFDVAGREKCLREHEIAKRAYQRKEELRKKRNEIKARKCQLQSDRYVQSQKSNFR